MILEDNKHVKGIYLFSETTEYEKGDFIVDKDCIYICLCNEPNTDRGTIIPANSAIDKRYPNQDRANYAPYPGDMITTAEEYYEYVRNSSNAVEDKYISSHVLNEILQNAYFGYSESGIIDESVNYRTEKSKGTTTNYLEVSEKLSEFVGRVTSKSKILDIIMRTEKLNNAVLKISPNLPELSTILVSKLDSKNTKEKDDEIGTIILRQYTYDPGYEQQDDFGQSYKVYHRVQELIDVADGQIYIRATKGSSYLNPKTKRHDTWTYSSAITQWKCMVEDENLLNHINNIINYIAEKEEEKSINEDTINSFCFHELKATETGEWKFRVDEDGDISKGIIPEDKSCPLIINVRDKISGSSNVYKSYTITVDTYDVIHSESAQQELYYLSDKLGLLISYDTTSSDITLTLQNTASTTAEIKDIYYRDYEKVTSN